MAPGTSSEADFRILGLEPDSKPSEVRQAYRALVKKWHPDRHHSEPYETKAFAEQKFREIDEAYRRISRNWQKTPRTPRSPTRAASPCPAPDTAQRLKTKVPGPPGAVGRSRIAIRPFTGAKIIFAVLLVAAFVYILTQLPSFLSDTEVDTGAYGPRVTEDLTGNAGPDSPTPSPPAEPQSSADTSNPAVPAPPLPPPGLLQPRATPSNNFFTLGSTTSEVLDVQGAPVRIQGQTWTYGLSEIQFKNGRVWKFNNFDGSLRVRMMPGVAEDLAAPPHITIGSSEDEVLLVQGTPTRVEGNKWFYGFGELVFKDGRVAEYDNYFGTLKISLLPSAAPNPEPAKNFFTIGSTTDQVLAVQGTPTSIHKNLWSFDFAVVAFRDGKVSYVTDTNGTLRFIAPQQMSDTEGS